MKILFLVLLLNLIHFGSCNEKNLIVKFNQQNDCLNPILGIPLKSNLALKEFTFCGMYSFKFLRGRILMAFTRDTYLWMMNYGEKMGALKMYNEYIFFDLQKQSMKPDQWQHICFSVSLYEVKIAMNGNVLKNETVNFSAEEITNDKLWIGGMQDSKWYTDRRMEGLVTDVHVWSESLEFQQLISITSNHKLDVSPPPDLFTWAKFKMQLNTSCIEYISIDGNDELFNEKTQRNVLMEYQTDIDSSNYFCHANSGKLLVPNTMQELEELDSYIQKSDVCTVAFLGLKKINDTMVVDLEGKAAPLVKWGPKTPNGKTIQQCISLWESSFEDVRCHKEYCFACRIKSKNIFTLRGNLSNIEREYFVDMTKKETDIRGLLKTKCFWNGTWNFGPHLKLDEPTSNMPPVGVRRWNNGKLLKFTQCNGNEFTCHTYGNCITRTKRCNGHPDCPVDGSDERDCKIMTQNIGYDKKYPPKKNSTAFISMAITEIVDINELHMSYTFNLETKLKWFDSRIIFRNLKPNLQENQLNSIEIDELWTPEIFFLHSNEVHIKAGEIREGSNGIVRIQQNGPPKQNELSEMDEDYMYPGTDNPIEMVNYIVVKLGCKFDLTWYFYPRRHPYST